MSNSRHVAAVGVAILCAASVSAQQQPPVRPLGPVVSKATESFVSPMLTIRALPGGRVLVNDIASRRVLLLDSALAKSAVVADTTSATSNAYSGRMGGLFAYKSDSSLFVDPQSLSMLVLDGAGKVARVMSVPRSDHAFALTGMMGAPALDAGGRLVYRAPPRFRMMGGPPGAGGAPPGPPSMPDSAAIVRVDLSSRVLDTVGFIKTPKMNMIVNRSDDGRVSMTSEINPLPLVDDWTVLSDGTIAIVRGRDYHVDFIDPDGTKRSSPKVPFEWVRMGDEQKVAFIDSVKAQRERMMAEARNNPSAGGEGMRAAAGGGQMVIETRAAGAGGGNPPPRPAGDQARPMPQMQFVSPSELPDYRPPFFSGAVRADAQGNLWIRTTTVKAGGGPVYDVVNRKGELIDRVQIPVGRQIAGFGPDGAVYLTGREGTTTILERALVK